MPRPSSPEHLALRLARRSPLSRYGTGAVLLDNNGSVVGTGWSHPGDYQLDRYRSVHAELHALGRLRFATTPRTCIIATWSHRGRQATIARPCRECARLLVAAGVETVRYSDAGDVWHEIDLTGPLPPLRCYAPRVSRTGVPA